MKIKYRKRFLKELSKIPKGERLKIENFVFKELPEANSIFELGMVEQMKGSTGASFQAFRLYQP